MSCERRNVRVGYYSANPAETKQGSQTKRTLERVLGLRTTLIDSLRVTAITRPNAGVNSGKNIILPMPQFYSSLRPLMNFSVCLVRGLKGTLSTVLIPLDIMNREMYGGPRILNNPPIGCQRGIG